MKKTNCRVAFTLIELMVVVSIIAILTTLGISSYSTAIKKSRDGRCKSDIQNIAQALVLYRSDEGVYPGSTASLVANYMSAIPKDEKSGTDYIYTVASNFKTFSLCTPTALEYPKGNANSSSNTAFSNCVNTGQTGSTCVYYCVANP